MKRRDFLKGLGIVVPTLIVAPKLIFDYGKNGWHKSDCVSWHFDGLRKLETMKNGKPATQGVCPVFKPLQNMVS